MPKETIAQLQDEFVRDFNEIDDWMIQYDSLLELIPDMEPLEEGEKNEQTIVSGCQAKLWIVTDYNPAENLVHVRADSDALIVKGIVAVIVALFDERSPEEIIKADVDFLERTPLKEQISTDRFNGMQTVIKRIKDFSRHPEDTGRGRQ